MSIIEFHQLKKEDKPILDKYFQSRYYENSHLNFTNFYMWREPYHIQWVEDDGVLYLLCEWEGHLIAMQPIGPEEKMAEAIENLVHHYEEIKHPFTFLGLEKDFAEFLQKLEGRKFDIEAERDDFDYVYLAEKLITLSGRKLHSKKNHLNAFRKEHPDAEYLPITQEIIPACREELKRWYDLRIQDEPDDPFIGWEYKAINEIFDDYDYFKLKGGAIRLNGRIIAFTFGEQLNTDTVVVHVEKADPNIRGAYPAINQAYIANEWQGMTYVNREEDMGHEGLRKAKESYKPVKMIEKYNARLIEKF